MEAQPKLRSNRNVLYKSEENPIRNNILKRNVRKMNYILGRNHKMELEQRNKTESLNNRTNYAMQNNLDLIKDFENSNNNDKVYPKRSPNIRSIPRNSKGIIGSFVDMSNFSMNLVSDTEALLNMEKTSNIKSFITEINSKVPMQNYQIKSQGEELSNLFSGWKKSRNIGGRFNNIKVSSQHNRRPLPPLELPLFEEIKERENMSNNGTVNYETKEENTNNLANHPSLLRKFQFELKLEGKDGKISEEMGSNKILSRVPSNYCTPERSRKITEVDLDPLSAKFFKISPKPISKEEKEMKQIEEHYKDLQKNIILRKEETIKMRNEKLGFACRSTSFQLDKELNNLEVQPNGASREELEAIKTNVVINHYLKRMNAVKRGRKPDKLDSIEILRQHKKYQGIDNFTSNYNINKILNSRNGLYREIRTTKNRSYELNAIKQRRKFMGEESEENSQVQTPKMSTTFIGSMNNIKLSNVEHRMKSLQKLDLKKAKEHQFVDRLSLPKPRAVDTSTHTSKSKIIHSTYLGEEINSTCKEYIDFSQKIKRK